MRSTLVSADTALDIGTACGKWPRVLAEAALQAASSATPIRIVLYGRRHELHPVGALQGQPVLACQMRHQQSFPDHAARRTVRRRVGRRLRNPIIVFTDVSGLLEVWQWEEAATEHIFLYRERTVANDDDRREIIDLLGRAASAQLIRATERQELGRVETRLVVGALLCRVRRRSPAAVPGEWLDARRRLRPLRLSRLIARIEASEKPETVRAFWRSLQDLRVFDARCGRGGRLAAVAAVLAPLYAACLQRMQSWVDDLDRDRTAHRSEKLGDFRRLLASAGDRRIYRDRADFVLQSILAANLYGADPDPGNVALARQRLLSLLGTPRADLPRGPRSLNLLVGDAALGFWTADALASAMGRAPEVDTRVRRLSEAAESIHLAREHLQRAVKLAEYEDTWATSCATLRERLQELRDELNALTAGEVRGSGAGAKARRMRARPHRPLHGWLEFYGILRRGGFDLVLGAPRRVRASHRGTDTASIRRIAAAHSARVRERPAVFPRSSDPSPTLVSGTTPMARPFTEIEFDSREYPSILQRLLGSDAPRSLFLRGDVALLNEPLLAFFCSNRLPGNLLLQTLDAARELRDVGVPTIGGFQTPLERECLNFLLRGRQPVVVSPARGIEPMRVPSAWHSALREGRLLLVSRFPGQRRRPTTRMAEARNALAAALAERVLITHASPGGRTYRLARQLVSWKKPMLTLDDPANVDLLRLGAQPVRPGTFSVPAPSDRLPSPLGFASSPSLFPNR